MLMYHLVMFIMMFAACVANTSGRFIENQAYNVSLSQKKTQIISSLFAREQLL